ncbi:MAG: hypothetical protein GY903_29850, partial [Fuerstiella sp.]|nr:hypothetical protein [Fuerstiella sp.]
GFTDAEGLLISGKTIPFGMAGGYLGAELARRSIGLKIKTGDTFVVPVAVAIAIGRPVLAEAAVTARRQIFPGRSHSHRLITPPPPHPTQRYESVFHLLRAWLHPMFNVEQKKSRWRSLTLRHLDIDNSLFEIGPSVSLRPRILAFHCKFMVGTIGI